MSKLFFDRVRDPFRGIKNLELMKKAATSGQFRELIGKLLVKIDDPKVRKINGKKIQQAIDAADSTAEEFIHWINNGCKIAAEAIKHFFLPEVTSDGTTGKKWIKRLQEKDYRVSDWARDVLRKKAFVATNGKTYKPVVIFGHEFEDDDRTTENIRKEAERRGYITPPAELAPNLREKVSDEEMGEMDVWALIVMHEPIKDSDGDPDLLALRRRAVGRWLRACYDSPGHRWDRGRGFVFLLLQE